MAEKIKVALLGAGNVGSQAARILVEDNAVLEKRIGAPVELIGIAAVSYTHLTLPTNREV